MLFVVFVGAVLAAAHRLSAKMWAWGGGPDDAPGPFERASSVALLAFGIAIATDWVLALVHAFTGWALACASAAMLLVVMRTTRFSVLRARLSARLTPTREAAIVALAVAPFVLWIAYALVRGTIVFPFVSDALSYHLPKALSIARAHTYRYFDGPDLRLSAFPADYELLLADVIALTGSDALTGSVGTMAYVLFGAVAAGVAERWWGRGALHVVATTLLALAMPTVVLISAAHKNDTLLGACMLAAIHWTARWAARGERAALVLAAIGTSVAIGTKISGGVLAPALAPLVLWRVRTWRRDGRPLSLGDTALWAAGGAALFLLLGGAAYVVNILHVGRPFPAMKGAGYGDWKNLWMFPYLVFARPLSLVDASWVPWKHKYWFWPEWDLFFSTYGLPTTLALFGMPFAVTRYRKSGLTTERALASVAALLAWVAIVPSSFPQPVGFFEGLVRYTHFLPPILLAATVAPLVLELSHSKRWRSFALGAVIGTGVTYAYVALRSAINDAYAPIDFVAAVFADPKYSRAIRTWTTRAGSWVDANAGPNDVIAFDGAFDAWIYPAYGAELSRRLIFLHADAAPPKVPSDADWVAIDRSWSCVFGHPKFVDFGVWSKYILRGKALPEDLVVYNQVLTDPHFKLVYRDDRANQAVFKRISPSDISPRDVSDQ